jgi:Carboxypeptidase regulatory-like domain/TonB-dependent Receptor Plug Domain/TonB dependent receptor
MRTRFRGNCLLIGLLAFALVPTISVGQTSKGTIAGTITDPAGGAISGATVTAQSTQLGENRSTVTGTYGEYRISAVLPGIYQVKVTANGFATVVLDNVEVGASVQKSLDVRMEVSSSAQTITVESSGATLQTESAELSGSISKTEIQQLPINSLNPISLVLTEPGAVRVSQRDDFTNGASFSVDGLRPRANNFLIDGFDNNDNGIAGQAIQPVNLEAISEVVVQTNSYAAEFGRGGASLTNVIYSSGTNNWHGAGYWRYDGATFNAVTPEQARNGATSPPAFVENIPGFRIGGPIVKNKLFVFGSSQWDRLRGAEQGAQMVIPTAAGVATLQSLNNPQAQILLNSLGGAVSILPNNPDDRLSPLAIGDRPGCPACSVEIATFSRSASQVANSYEYVIRGDYVASDKDTISARWLASHSSLTPDLFANPNALPGVDTQQGGPSRSIGVFWTHVINNHTVNELRFTGQTINFGFDPTATTLSSPFANLPDFEVSGLTGVDFGGIALGFPQDRDHLVFQYQDALSLTLGHHNLKMGADITHLGITDGVPFNSRGLVQYDTGGDCSAINLTTGTGLANYLDDFSGAGGSAAIQFGVSQVSYAQTQQAFYAQDEWKLRPNLTLTYGLRYEYQGVPLNSLPFPAVDVNTALTDSLTKRVEVQTDRNNFGPRFGFAYTPRILPGLFGNGKTVLRAGFGTFYDVLFSNILANNAASTPNVTGGTVIGALTAATPRGVSDFSTVVPSITPALSPFDSVTTVASDLHNPTTLQWNVNVERSLPGNLIATVAYVGTRGEYLYLNHELNPGVDSVRLNPDRGSIFARTNNGDSIYHALQTRVERSFKNGLLFRGAYTFSRSIDNGSEVFVTSGGSTRAQDQFSFRGDRGPSAFDRKHRAVFTWVYQLPTIHGDSGALRALKFVTNGWQVSGTASFESGAPETISFGGFDQNGDLSGFNDRPSLGNPAVPINYSPACRNAASTCNTGVGFTLDGVNFADFNSSFGVDAGGNPVAKASDFHYLFIQGKNGSVGRNTFYNPGRQDWAMSIQREFKIHESQAFLLRMEAFNPFNHPNLGGGEDGVPSVSGDIVSPDFLNTSVTRVGGRSVKFFVRYSF